MISVFPWCDGKMRSTSPDEDDKMRKTHFLSLTLIFSSAIGLCLAASWTYPQGKTITAVNPATPLEMTSLDLASVKVWNSNLVSALGFMLGMNRKDVYKIAQQQSLDLDDELGQACLNGKSCSVFSRGRDLGLTLSFNDEGVVDKVRIMLFSRSVPKEDQSEWLARKFRGETYKLAADYSDNQRIRVLGLADVEQAGRLSRTYSTFLSHEYQYRRRGLILHVDLLKPTGFSLSPPVSKVTLDLVPPRRM